MKHIEPWTSLELSSFRYFKVCILFTQSLHVHLYSWRQNSGIAAYVLEWYIYIGLQKRTLLWSPAYMLPDVRSFV